MSAEASALLKRAEQARRENRFPDAREDLIAAIEHLRVDRFRSQLAQALRTLGEVERRLHDGDAARRHYEEAVTLYREEGDPLRLAHTVRHLGDVHHDQGRSELAEPCYREALDVYRSQPKAPRLDVANAIRSMAVLKDEAGDVDEARRLWEEARDLYTAVHVPEGVDESSRRLARLDRPQGPVE